MPSTVTRPEGIEAPDLGQTGTSLQRLVKHDGWGTKNLNTAGFVAHSDGMPRRNSATKRRCLLTAMLQPSIAGACRCNGSVEQS